MVFNNKETVISNITCNGKLKEHRRGSQRQPCWWAAIFRRRQIWGRARGWEASSRGRCWRSMGRAGRGGGEGEAGQGRLGGADWSKCEVGQGEVPRVVKWANSRPLDLWSWQMALEISLCWFVSILLMILLELVVVLLQRLESNNGTLS